MAVSIITDSTFPKEVIESQQPVLVDFWAEWCGPCRALAPKLEELSEELQNIRVVKINVDENPDTPSQYGIRGIPALLFFHKGELKGQLVGNQTKDEIKKLVDTHNT